MTKILIVKTSSMGDIIHTLPALSDAAKHITNVSFNWVIEPSFSEIPVWHPNVSRVIPVPLRKFRKEPMRLLKNGEVQSFFNALREERYDYVIDAQGLIKSAILTRLAKGLRCGLDRHSVWESLACLAYKKKVSVQPTLHAITRMRQLFSKILDYSLEEGSLPDYGLQLPKESTFTGKPYLVFIHGTTWVTKEWPESYWSQLAKIAVSNGFDVLLPWGNAVEQERAVRIKADISEVTVLPKTTLTDMAKMLGSAVGAVSVDTGLGHLAAALSVPTVSIYGPTDPKEVGTQGKHQQHVVVDFKCSPCWNQKCGYQSYSAVTPACFSSVSPTLVWENLQKVIQIDS